MLDTNYNLVDYFFMGGSGPIWPLFYTGLFYLIFNGLLTVIFGKLEKKLDYFKS